VLPQKVSADSGFFSADNLTDPDLAAVELYVPPEKRVQKSAVAAAMREKLGSEEGGAVYARRKAVVEPVFGQVKAGVPQLIGLLAHVPTKNPCSEA